MAELFPPRLGAGLKSVVERVKGDMAASTPANKRLYAIGDIHGSLEALEALLALIEDDRRTAASSITHELIFLGDYVDRGPDSSGVLDRLIDIQNSDMSAIFLAGNHEASMMAFMDCPDEHQDWLDWGGEQTLASYGVEGVWKRTLADVAAALSHALPARQRQFLGDLTHRYEAGDYFFAHAGVKPGVPLKEQSATDLMWIRREFHDMPVAQRPSKVIVHGHHPVKRAKDYGWRINVDTGACWSGVLSAVVLEGAKRRFLSTSPKKST